MIDAHGSTNRGALVWHVSTEAIRGHEGQP